MVQPLTKSCDVRRAADYEEVRPLVALCRVGKLFEIQEWIANAKPVNPPVPTGRRRGRSPLEVAVELGFHSLVKVLLEAGAVDDNREHEALIYDAIHRRRFDLIELFIANGFDAASVDMTAVLESWEPGTMQYFIEKGASLQSGLPIAKAFCGRVRTALKIYKSYRESIPSLQEQANIALRYHCKEGNLKWVSLMLWAGADPYAPGVSDPEEEHTEGDEGLSALGFAALYRHYEIFGLKQIKLDPTHPQLARLIGYLSGEGGADLLLRLLKAGVNPNISDAEGCPAIQSHLSRLGWLLPSYWSFEREDGKIDTERDREAIKAIHLLAMHGAKWKPEDTREINYARKGLLKVKPDYTIEFVWIMSKYQAAELSTVEKLLSTPTIKRHLARSDRAFDILKKWRELSTKQMGTTDNAIDPSSSRA